MSKRRRHGEGSIFKRQDGLWVGTIDLGYADGKRQRKALYGKTSKDVQARLDEAKQAQRNGLPVARERQTVGQFLTKWIESARERVRARTAERYEQLVRIHVLPSLGHLQLARLSPQDLDAFYADRLKAGLSPASVRHVHRVLRAALGSAERWGLVARNVARLVSPPRAERREMQTLSPAQARRFLEVAQDDRLAALYALALGTGMRQGELLGLRWRDVDLDAGRLQVRATLQATKDGYVFAEPKTAKSRRQIALSQTSLLALRRHRTAQLEERLRLGPAWDDQDLVFANTIGRPLDQRNLTRAYQGLLRRAGLSRIRFHDLRHTAATLALGRGVHPKIVSEMLGHSQIAVTLDLYSHVTPTMHQEAADAIDAALRG